MINWTPYDRNSRAIESHVICLVTDGKNIYKADHAHRMFGYAWADDRGIIANVTHWSEMNLPQAIEPNEQPSEAAAESEVYGNDCRNGQC